MHRSASLMTSVLTTVLALSVAAGQAWAQAGNSKSKDKDAGNQPAAKQPANQPAKPAAVELTLGPYVARELPKDWTLRSRIRITSNPPGQGAQILSLPPGQLRDENAVQLGQQSGFTFQTMTVVFPVMPETAGAAPNDDAIEGWMKVDDVEVATPRMSRRGSAKESIASGVRLAQFTTRTGSGSGEVKNGTAREVEMQIEVPMVCYRTKFDERGAANVDWPKEDFPSSIKAVFQPQLYVETGPDAQPYDQNQIKALVKRAVGEDPRKHKPVMLAKLLAAEVVRSIQPSGDSKAVLRTGELQGFILNGIDNTIATGKGTEFDMACLLTAMYRSAGLPARLIIGVEAEDVDRKFLEKKGGKGKMRAWTEFALYDEAASTLNWVPVDIAKIRKQSSRPQPVDRAWKYFGSHDELNVITPLAMHFHPPTTVIAYSVPGLWGWAVTPTPPGTAYQALYFDAYRSARRPADNNKSGGGRN
ncbi:MAG: hypothetical protein AMXMBFR58_23220 [Phycisphaerae bacterium]|nr:hypothetical protein [Phycisphaerales bacterium]MCK6475460.1 transglutaminase-like domain-containing protein [Phycisphaerales bacterium]